MITGLLHVWLDALFAHEVIDGHGRRAYLHRWVLWKWQDGRALYLHHFIGSDWSRDLHDHPKAFASFGLWGGYVESFVFGNKADRDAMHPDRWMERTFRAPFFRVFSATHTHRLRLLNNRPAWTIVFTGSRETNWGFYTEGGWVDWESYVNSNLADDALVGPNE